VTQQLRNHISWSGFEPRAGVHRVADGSDDLRSRRPHRADDCLAVVNADPDPQRLGQVFPELVIKLFEAHTLEGFGEFALLGTTEIIKRCRPLLILETVPSPNSNAERSLKALGYRVRRTFDANTLLDCD
jgi:hypothetical protein